MVTEDKKENPYAGIDLEAPAPPEFILANANVPLMNRLVNKRDGSGKLRIGDIMLGFVIDQKIRYALVGDN